MPRISTILLRLFYPASISRIVLAFMLAIGGMTVLSYIPIAHDTTVGTLVSAVGIEGVVTTLAAEAPAPAPAPTVAPQNPFTIIGELLNGAIQIMVLLLTPMLLLTSWLLTPDWTMGQVFGLRPILYSLWILVSNVVYVIFAGALVIMAFMNIFGSMGGKSNWELKTMLPKFVVGLMIVPLSWFIVSGMLSFTNILSASIMGIPYSMINTQGGSLRASLEKTEIPTECTIDMSGKGTLDGKNNDSKMSTTSSTDANTQARAAASAKTLNCKGNRSIFSALSGNGAFSLLSIYAYGIFKIQDFDSISKVSTASGAIKSISDIGIQILLDLIFFVAFGLIVFALFFAMLTRAFYLWIFIIFSPMFGLLHFMGDKIKQDKLKQFEISKFIGLAMVPVYVSAALAFGMIFVSVTMATNLDKTKDQMGSTFCTFGSDGATDGSKQIIACGPEGNKMTLHMQGLPIGNEPGKSLGAGILGDAMNIGFGFIGKVMINAIALGVLWIGVMTALKSSDLTSAAVTPFVQFGESIGKIAQNVPQYMPIVPMPKFDGNKMTVGGLSPYALWQGASQFQSSIQSGMSKSATSFAESLRQMTGVGDPKDIKLASATQKINTVTIPAIKNTAENNYTELGRAVKQGFQGIVSADDTVRIQDLFNNPTLRDPTVSMLESVSAKLTGSADKALIKDMADAMRAGNRSTFNTKLDVASPQVLEALWLTGDTKVKLRNNEKLSEAYGGASAAPSGGASTAGGATPPSSPVPWTAPVATLAAWWVGNTGTIINVTVNGAPSTITLNNTSLANAHNGAVTNQSDKDALVTSINQAVRDGNVDHRKALLKAMLGIMDDTKVDALYRVLFP